MAADGAQPDAPAEPPAGQDPAGLDALGALAEGVRASAKWLIASFAAVGALLVPGLQLAGLGSLHGWRLAWAVIAAVAAVGAAVFAAVTIARVLSMSRPTLGELVAREADHRDDDRLIKLVELNKTLLEHEASNLRELRKLYREATEQREAALAALGRAGAEKPPAPLDPAAASRAEKCFAAASNRVLLLAQIIDNVAAVADFQDVRSDFLKRRWRVAVATLIVAIGMAGFAVEVHTAGHATGDFSNANLTGLDFSGANLDQADFHGAHLDMVDMHGTSLKAADLSGAHLSGVNLEGADTRGVNSAGAVVQGSVCANGHPSDHSVSGCFVPRPLVPPAARVHRRPGGNG